MEEDKKPPQGYSPQTSDSGKKSTDNLALERVAAMYDAVQDALKEIRVLRQEVNDSTVAVANQAKKVEAQEKQVGAVTKIVERASTLTYLGFIIALITIFGVVIACITFAVTQSQDSREQTKTLQQIKDQSTTPGNTPFN